MTRSPIGPLKYAGMGSLRLKKVDGMLHSIDNPLDTSEEWQILSLLLGGLSCVRSFSRCGTCSCLNCDLSLSLFLMKSINNFGCRAGDDSPAGSDLIE